MKNVRANVSLAADLLKRRATRVVYAPQGAKESVKSSVSELPEMQTDLLHEGPHPGSRLPWSIKTLKAEAKAKAKASTVPQDFSTDDEAVTEELRLSPAARVLTGETVRMHLTFAGANLFTVSVAMTPGSSSTARISFDRIDTKASKRLIKFWGSQVPAIAEARVVYKSKAKGGVHLRIPKRNLAAVMLRLEEL